MPRDDDKNNDSRGRRDRPSGKSRSGVPRGPDKKFAKRGFAGKRDGEKRPYAAKRDDAKSYGKKPYSASSKPYAGKRDGAAPRRDFDDAPRRFDKDAPRPLRGDRSEPRKDFRPRDDRSSEKRSFAPRGDRPNYRRDDRAAGEGRGAGRFSDKKFGDKRPYTPRDGGEEKRPYTPRGE